MAVLGLLLTWVVPSFELCLVLRTITSWKLGWLAAVSGMVPPVGAIVYFEAFKLVAFAFPITPITLSIVFPGAVAVVCLAVLLRLLGVRPIYRYQSVALLVVLFAASALPIFALFHIAAGAQPGL